jgi:hypothetical protein
VPVETVAGTYGRFGEAGPGPWSAGAGRDETDRDWARAVLLVSFAWPAGRGSGSSVGVGPWGRPKKATPRRCEKGGAGVQQSVLMGQG